MGCFLDWLCGLFVRVPQPPEPKPLPESVNRAPGRGSPRDLKSEAEVGTLESLVHQEVLKNNRTSLASIREGHRAISAEERSRSMLDDLMRAMDRGC